MFYQGKVTSEIGMWIIVSKYIFNWIIAKGWKTLFKWCYDSVLDIRSGFYLIYTHVNHDCNITGTVQPLITLKFSSNHIEHISQYINVGADH